MDMKILEEVHWGYSKLAVVVDGALRKLGYNHRFQIIANPNDFPNYGVSKTPALIIDDKIVIEGRVPTILEMVEILKEA